MMYQDDDALAALSHTGTGDRKTREDSDGYEALIASHAFVKSMMGKADGAMDFGSSPFWHGWALCEAFLAGAKWQATHERRGPHVS